MNIAPRKFCGSWSDCYEGCNCAKCVDPVGYQEWKELNPEEYQIWLNKERERFEVGEYDG